MTKKLSLIIFFFLFFVLFALDRVAPVWAGSCNPNSYNVGTNVYAGSTPNPNGAFSVYVTGKYQACNTFGSFNINAGGATCSSSSVIVDQGYYINDDNPCKWHVNCTAGPSAGNYSLSTSFYAGQWRENVSCSGSYSINCVSYSGTACTSAANNCGQTNSGTYSCTGVCSASTPANGTIACTSNAGCNDNSSCTTDTCTINTSNACFNSCSNTNNPVNGAWGALSACTRSCDGGTQTKTCNNPSPSCSGSECTRETGATEGAGTLTTSDNRTETFACNTQPCNATPNTPTLAAPPDNTWINGNPTFSVTVTDPDGGNVKARFDLDSDGTVDGEGNTVTSGNNSTWTPASIPDTSGRTWRAKAQDPLAAEGAWSSPSWTLLKDTVAPTVPLTVSPTGWTNINPTWGWSTASDDRSGLRSANTYEAYLNGVYQLTTTSTSYTPSLTDGTYSVQVCAYDNAGNRGCSVNVTVQIDRTLPVITSLTSSYVPLSSDARWDWSASDSGGSLLRTTNTYLAELSGPSGTTTTYTNNSYFQINTVPDGTYSLRVHAYDSAGNEGFSGWSPVIIDTCPPPTIPGSVRETHGGCPDNNPIWAWEASTTTVGVIDYYEVVPTWTDNVFVYPPSLTYAPLLTVPDKYAIKVRAHNSCGRFSDYSPLVVAAIGNTASACQLANNLSVSWNQPADSGISCGSVSDYWIQLSESSAVDAGGNFQTVLGPEFNKVFTLPAVAGRVTYLTDVTTYLTVSPKTFYFHVKARDVAGNFSAWSPTTSAEVKKVPAISSLNITNISPFPLTPNTTNFSVTADINLSGAGAVCTACSQVCEAWKITRGATTPVNYADTEVCTDHTEAPTFTVTTPFNVLSKLPAGFSDGDYLSVRATIRDCDSGTTFTREYTRKVAYVSWFQALNGDVYGQSITEYVERNAAGQYESYMVANLTPDNKTTGDLPGGLALSAGAIDVVDTVGNLNRASERTGVTGDIWAIANYSPGINWPETFQNSLIGPTAGDFIHYTGAELVINSGSVDSYNNKVVYADGNITIDGSLTSGPGFGSGYALTAVLVANGKITINDTSGSKPGNGNDMFKLLGGLYAKEGIDMPRSLGNNKFPAVSVTYDPGVFFKNVSGLALPQYTWREVNQ